MLFTGATLIEMVTGKPPFIEVIFLNYIYSKFNLNSSWAFLKLQFSKLVCMECIHQYLDIWGIWLQILSKGKERFSCWSLTVFFSCFKPDPSERPTAAELLNDPFILQYFGNSLVFWKFLYFFVLEIVELVVKRELMELPLLNIQVVSFIF